jgi:hypothetical protein
MRAGDVRRIAIVTVLTASVGVCIGTMLLAQTETVEWPRGAKISDAEKREILELSRIMGLDDVAKVTFDRTMILASGSTRGVSR